MLFLRFITTLLLLLVLLPANVYAEGVSTAVFIDSFSVSSQEARPTGLAFNTEGTKMFVVGRDFNRVREYTLSTSFDISAASFVDSLDVGGVLGGNIQGVTFNDDGTKMFLLSSFDDAVFEYALSTAFDVSTGVYNNASTSVAAQEAAPLDLAFSDDGTKMFIVGSSGADVNEYTLSAAFDVTTASFVDSFSVASQETGPQGLDFSTDGTVMYVVGNLDSDAVNEYTLSTAFDVSTASFSQSFSVAEQETTPTAVTFNNDGSEFFVLGFDSDSVHRYILDDTAPTFSSLAAAPSDTSATITWTTDDKSSSQIEYGLSSGLANSTTTAVADTSPRVTNHSVGLSGLASCTTYYYRVIAQNYVALSATSSTDSFTTTGCTGNATVIEETTSDVDSSSGGTVTLSDLSLEAPANYAESLATFQVKKLDSTELTATTGVPSGRDVVSGSTYQLRAFTGPDTELTSFTKPITVTLAYSTDLIAGLNQSTLRIHRWNGSAWSELSGCVLNLGNTVSCTTTEFSDFGLFGEGTAVLPGGGSYKPPPGSASSSTSTSDMTQQEEHSITQNILKLIQRVIDLLREQVNTATRNLSAAFAAVFGIF